jgi:hypothetical protein
MARLPPPPDQDYPPIQSPPAGSGGSGTGGAAGPSTGTAQGPGGATVQVYTGSIWRPAPFADPELDLAVKTAYDHISGLQATKVQSPATLQGSSVSAGAATVTGSLKGVATGLSTVSTVVASLDTGTTPTNMTVSATPSTIAPGSIDIYVYAPSATNNNTPILAASALKVRWHAWGT